MLSIFNLQADVFVKNPLPLYSRELIDYGYSTGILVTTMLFTYLIAASILFTKNELDIMNIKNNIRYQLNNLEIDIIERKYGNDEKLNRKVQEILVLSKDQDNVSEIINQMRSLMSQGEVSYRSIFNLFKNHTLEENNKIVIKNDGYYGNSSFWIYTTVGMITMISFTQLISLLCKKQDLNKIDNQIFKSA